MDCGSCWAFATSGALESHWFGVFFVFLLCRPFLNASINSLPAPVRIMNYRQDDSCKLCGHKKCSLMHILSWCPIALKQKRYTFRHDSVLSTLKPVLLELIQKHNSKSQVNKLVHPNIKINFRSAKDKSTKSVSSRARPKPQDNRSLLDGANDWKCLVDFDRNNIVFPPHICATSDRPDIIIYSNLAKFVILIELTCPAEEYIEAAAIRKVARYVPLSGLIRDNGWNVSTMTIEVGCRGFVAHSVRMCLKRLGFSNSACTRICRKLSNVVSRCSFAMWLSRNSPTSDVSKDLVSA